MCTIHAGCVVALRCHILQTVIEPWHARVSLWSDWWSTVLTYSPWVDSTSPSILDLIIFGKTLQLVSWCDARLRLVVSIVCMEDLLRLRAVGIWVEICLSQATSSDCRQRWWMWYFLNSVLLAYWHIIDITWYVISCMMYDVQGRISVESHWLAQTSRIRWLRCSLKVLILIQTGRDGGKSSLAP